MRHIDRRLEDIRAEHAKAERAAKRALRRAQDTTPVWDPPNVELLSIPQLLALPNAFRHRARSSGVYFLWMGTDLQYVGSSADIRSRIRNHLRSAGSEESSLMFSRATFLSVEWPWHLAIEAIYIRHYKPPKNTQSVWLRRGGSELSAGQELTNSKGTLAPRAVIQK